MAHRKWKETKLQPGIAGPGNMLGCCLVSFQFLWAIHPICPVGLKLKLGDDPQGMTRLQVQAAVALLLIVTALLLYSASLKSVPKTQWRQPRVAPWTYNMSAIDNVETVGYPNSLLTYGANKEAPEFVPQPEKGARILIFAYAR